MEASPHTLEQFREDLHRLGLRAGDIVMMHSSYKSLGGIEGGAAGLFSALKQVLGADGTLILPAFSYDTVNYSQPVFDRSQTPSCIGYLPEYFRTQVPGVIRSMHATHSCCLWGKRAEELAAGHELDLTPVGEHSPLTRLPQVGGKILLLGSNSNNNTSLHGVEETAEPPYLFDRERPIEYLLQDGDCVIRQQALRHCFHKGGICFAQRYARIIPLLSAEECSHGYVLDAECRLLSAKAVWEKGKKKLLEDPFYFVDQVPGQA